jgi:hypothetical protein
MKKIIGTTLAVLFAANFSYALAQATPATPAQPAAPAAATTPAMSGAHDCTAKAVDKNGKPLAGAARSAFMKKCEADMHHMAGCEAKAVSKSGKPLTGAAKDSFMKKCEAGM